MSSKFYTDDGQPLPYMRCGYCGTEVPVFLIWRRSKAGEQILEARCMAPECKRRIRYLPQIPEILKLAPPRPAE